MHVEMHIKLTICILPVSIYNLVYFPLLFISINGIFTSKESVWDLVKRLFLRFNQSLQREIGVWNKILSQKH